MNQQDIIDAKISEAWKSHRAGQNETAIEQFLELLQEAPDHIDAYWGLGLSYRNVGDRQSALEAFHRVRELVSVGLDAEDEDRERFFMLKRMVTQQIEQIEDFLG